MAKKQDVVNAPQPVRVEGNPEGLVEVSPLYLWIRMTEHGKRKQYKIFGKELYRWCNRPLGVLLMGKLSFRLKQLEDRKMVVIEPRDETDDFQFEVTIGLWGLNEALYFFMN